MYKLTIAKLISELRTQALSLTTAPKYYSIIHKKSKCVFYLLYGSYFMRGDITSSLFLFGSFFLDFKTMASNHGKWHHFLTLWYFIKSYL